MVLTMKPLYLYKLQLPTSYDGYEDYYKKLLDINNDNDHVLCLGEIGNMKDHYAVVTHTGKVIYGLHPEIFVELSEDEV